MLEEGYSTLDLGSLDSVAIVLDASESANESRELVQDTVRQLIDKLPGSLDTRLFFLGNSREYSIREFSRRGASWWSENEHRGSFLSPILEATKASNIVVIGTGQIYDLEDWRGTVFASNMILANVGYDSMQGGTGVGMELDNPNPTELASLVFDPVVSVEISGEGFMPYYWDNPEYGLSLGDEVMLKSERPTSETPRALSVSLAYFGRFVRALIQRESGRMDDRELPPAKLDFKDDWMPLPDKEAEALKSILKGQEFTCPNCERQHPSSTVTCHTHDTFLGEPVFPSFTDMRGFVFFREASNDLLYRVHGSQAAKVGQYAVAIRNGPTADCYEYDSATETFRDKGKLEPYHRVGDEFVIVV